MLILLIDLYSMVLFAAVILSWLNLSPENPVVRIVHQLTEPVLEPVRRLLPRTAGFDLSPVIVLLALHLLKRLLVRF
jgi:YggT family protein